MRHVPLDHITYTGIDIVSDLAKKNQDAFGTDKRQFLAKDIVNDELPKRT